MEDSEKRLAHGVIGLLEINIVRAVDSLLVHL